MSNPPKHHLGGQSPLTMLACLALAAVGLPACDEGGAPPPAVATGGTPASGGTGGGTGGGAGEGWIAASGAGPGIRFAGVNLAGAEFGQNVPGVYGSDYTYPSIGDVNYFLGKGMNTIRLPFRWERLQPTQSGDFDPAEQGRLDGFVSQATQAGAWVILDPHNFARYYDQVVGEAVPVEAFADLWSRLATLYMDNELVIFGLMNEPRDMDTEVWRDDANAAIAAIRATGATNLILVPGNGYSGAHSWSGRWYGTPNSELMLDVTDPGDNYAFEPHQYLDDNSSGAEPVCVNATIGSTRLQDFTQWARRNGKQALLGEVGIDANDTCMAALDDMLTFMENNSDVWIGWTYWAAGPWWGSTYYSIQPEGGVDKPQMEVLARHL